MVLQNLNLTTMKNEKKANKALEGKKLLLGISGSIAAYKTPELVRLFSAQGAVVRCVLTNNGSKFVTPLTLQAVSNNKVYTSMFDAQAWEMEHISLAVWADLIVIAPASADIIARLAGGRAEDLLSSVVLAFKKQVLVCPAMNAGMWAHPATKNNIKVIKDYGYILAGPDNGELACGTKGVGRLTELNSIIQAVINILS